MYSVYVEARTPLGRYDGFLFKTPYLNSEEAKNEMRKQLQKKDEDLVLYLYSLPEENIGSYSALDKHVKIPCDVLAQSVISYTLVGNV